MLVDQKLPIALLLTLLPGGSNAVRRSAGRRIYVEISKDSLAQDAAFVDTTRNASQLGVAYSINQSSMHGWISQRSSFPVLTNNLHTASLAGRPNASAAPPRSKEEASVNFTKVGSTAVNPPSRRSSSEVALAEMGEMFRLSPSKLGAGDALPASGVGINLSQHTDLRQCLVAKLGLENHHVCPNAIGCAVGCVCGFGQRCFVKDYIVNDDILTSCPDLNSNVFEGGREVNVGWCQWNMVVMILAVMLIILMCCCALCVAKSAALAFWCSDD